MKKKQTLLQYLVIGILLTAGTMELKAQKECEEVNTIQPSIMVLPRTMQGEDLRTIMDEQPEVRVAISMVKQAFDDRGYTTMDFETTLSARMKDEMVTKESQTEFKTRIFRNIPSDILVEIDVIIREVVTNNGNNYMATLILEANVSDNGYSMASVPMVGNMYDIEDKISLIESAMKKENDNNEVLLDEFLRTMDEKWAEIRERGKTVKMEFSLAQSAIIDMDGEVESQGEKLKYVIEDWLEKTAYKKYYVVTMVSATRLLVEDYRYPVRNPKNCTNMTARTIERQLDRFFGEINLPVKFDSSRGTLYITIL